MPPSLPHTFTTTSAKAQLMRRLNRSAVLDLVREHSPTSATEISHRLDLTLPTVLRILAELESEGLIRETGNTQASGGRPRSLIEFNPTRSAVIGIDLSGTSIYGTIADLGGTIQEEITYNWGVAEPDHPVRRLEEIIAHLIHAPRPEGQVIRGIGIGAPGVTLPEQGEVVLAVSLGWRNLPLRDLLQERFRLPVQVENDVNLAALGEYGFGAGQGANSLVCFSIGTGIGAGIILDRKIYHGSHSYAGEIGYLPPGVNHLKPTFPDFGALESVASGTSIVARVQAALQSHGLDPQEVTLEKLFTPDRLAQPWAAQIFAETVDYIALAVASICTIIDPEVIVLGGGMLSSDQIDWAAPVQARLTGVIPALPRVVQTQLGARAAVMGAIMSVLDATTDHLAINRLA